MLQLHGIRQTANKSDVILVDERRPMKHRVVMAMLYCSSHLSHVYCFATFCYDHL